MRGKPLPMMTNSEQVEHIKALCDMLPSGCWQYRCDLPALVYPYFRFNRESWMIHRFMYTALVGPIPDGMQCCHTCDNCHCVNPSHIFLGTHKDNALDSVRKLRHYTGSKTHCIRGHSFAEVGYLRNDGRRGCKSCDKSRWDRERQLGTRPANKVKTHCIRGHEFAGENLYIKPNGERQCRACRRSVVYERLMRRPLSRASGGPT